ncbi:MAG: hypothetical protein KJO61_06000 [Deltaproteobacteria bacterium]|nr:hypothetical protein [Deltaproteobacteria bacterium]
MIKFYTNRELSQKLKINLARWKRWSREFLPPDPLGGIQSGYARQYSMDTAFTVYLGGYLVGELKYTIAEAKKILEELKSWLKEKDFYINIDSREKSKTKEKDLVNEYIIFILRGNELKTGSVEFSYRIRGIISNTPVIYKECNVKQERYFEEYIGVDKTNIVNNDLELEKMLEITKIHRYFKNRLNQD